MLRSSNTASLLMKFCYCDESGTGDEPIAVMVGVIVDAQRMHCTKEDWSELLSALEDRAGRSISEMHTRDFYAGNSPWRKMTGPERAAVVSDVCGWLKGRKHRLIFTALNKAAYFSALSSLTIPSELNTPWRFMGFHLALALQRAHQHESRHKGHTLLVFDNEERERMRFTDIICRPQSWSDQYYDRREKQEQLDQIIDVPYFGDSREVGLLQVADFAAFFFRRYAELSVSGSEERFTGERNQIEEWARLLSERAIEGRHVFPKKNRSDAAELFWRFAPESIRGLYE